VFAGLLPSENWHKIGEFLLALACDVTVGHQIIKTKCRKIRYPFAKVKKIIVAFVRASLHSPLPAGPAPLNSASTS